MAAISSLGVGSGLDLSNLVNNLVQATQVPAENGLNRRESRLATELSGVGLMRSALAEFQTSLAGLSDTDSFQTRKLSNSDSAAITAAVSNKAAIGDYDIKISNLAENQTLATVAFADINDTIGSGTIQINFGTITGPGFTSFALNSEKTAQTIVIDSSNNSLTGLRDYINNNDFNITAAIINDGTGYRLTLTSEESGANSAMEINITDTGDGNNIDALGLSRLAFNTSATNVTETRAGEDAALTINGLAISSTSNTLTDAIEGVDLTLNQETEAGASVSIKVSESTTSISSSIEKTVDSFNSMIETLNNLGSSNPDSGEVGILVGDTTLRNLINRVKTLMTSPVDGLTGSITALVDIGITTQNDGSLAIDSSRFQTAIDDNPTGALALFAPVGQPSDSQIEFKGSTDLSEPGLYGINITQIATQGVLNGATVLPAAFPITIDSNNDNLSISVDGKTSGVISLTIGSYATAAQLAAEIQLRINSSDLLVDAGKSVSVSYDSSNNRFDITSNSYGSTSAIEIDSVDTNTTSALGFSVASGTAGLDVAGSIGGVTATGEGQQLTSTAGLSIIITGGSTGSRGSLEFSRGFIENLDSLLQGYLESDGILSARETGLNESLDDIVDERENLSLRLDALEARLVAQFSALDLLVAEFQSTSSFLTGALANLPGFTRKSSNN